MALLTPAVVSGAGIKSAVPNTLTASDTFVYSPNSHQQLILHNPTAGALSPTITGSGAPASYSAPGGPIGANLSTGIAVGSIPVGATRVINLDTIANYLVGTITITAGTGLLGWINSDF